MKREALQMQTLKPTKLFIAETCLTYQLTKKTGTKLVMLGNG